MARGDQPSTLSLDNSLAAWELRGEMFLAHLQCTYSTAGFPECCEVLCYIFCLFSIFPLVLPGNYFSFGESFHPHPQSTWSWRHRQGWHFTHFHPTHDGQLKCIKVSHYPATMVDSVWAQDPTRSIQIPLHLSSFRMEYKVIRLWAASQFTEETKKLYSEYTV